MERRTFVRLLVVFAIGIPVLVEAVTFLGLIEHQLLDGSSTPTAPATTSTRGVAVGDELLPSTTPNETVVESAIRGTGTPWVYVLQVEVVNPTESAYELRLGRLSLQDGVGVAGGASSGRVGPGDTGGVTGAWEIPAGSTPRQLEVTAIVYTEAGPTPMTTTVTLGNIPVRGS